MADCLILSTQDTPEKARSRYCAGYPSQPFDCDSFEGQKLVATDVRQPAVWNGMTEHINLLALWLSYDVFVYYMFPVFLPFPRTCLKGSLKEESFKI